MRHSVLLLLLYRTTALAGTPSKELEDWSSFTAHIPLLSKIHWEIRILLEITEFP